MGVILTLAWGLALSCRAPAAPVPPDSCRPHEARTALPAAPAPPDSLRACESGAALLAAPVRPDSSRPFEPDAALPAMRAPKAAPAPGLSGGTPRRGELLFRPDPPPVAAPVYAATPIPSSELASRLRFCSSGRVPPFRRVASMFPGASPSLAADTPTAPAREGESDRWFAEDKLKHFFVSFAAQSIGFGGARALGLRRGPALATASGVAVALGVGKEIRDRRTGGDASARDLTWDAIGVAAAAAVSAQTR